VCVYLLFYVLSSISGCAGLVGISLASRVTYIFACVSLRCVDCRAGTSIFGHSGGVGSGTVRIFYFTGSVLAGTVRLKWWGGGDEFSFSFSSVFRHFSWRVDMRGRDIALYFLWYFVVVSCGFSYTSC
jgi:hypothetical protein